MQAARRPVAATRAATVEGATLAQEQAATRAEVAATIQSVISVIQARALITACSLPE
jgi:hypothetical protein